MPLLELFLLIGAIAWWTIALVTKDGPFKLILWFRELIDNVTGLDSNPLHCQFCAGFWVGLAMSLLYLYGDTTVHVVIQFFGILGLVNAVRGNSGEY